MDSPSIEPGWNIAMKVPAGLFGAAVDFYRRAVGLDVIAERPNSVGFAFGSMTLWIDGVDHATHAEVWLELVSSAVPEATDRLVAAGARVADEIETLERADRHWIIDPGGAVLLLTPPGDPPG